MRCVRMLGVYICEVCEVCEECEECAYVGNVRM